MTEQKLPRVSISMHRPCMVLILDAVSFYEFHHRKGLDQAQKRHMAELRGDLAKSMAIVRKIERRREELLVFVQQGLGI